MTTSLLVLVVCMLVVIVVATTLGRRLGAKRMAAFATMALGGLFSVSMLVVTAALAFKVWAGVDPAAQFRYADASVRDVRTDVHSTASSASSADEGTGADNGASDNVSPKSETSRETVCAPTSTAVALESRSNGPPRADRAGETDNSKDAIANAMTAIGTVVAVVALILSVGTTWFAQLVQKLLEMQARLEDQRKEFEAQELTRQKAREIELKRLRFGVEVEEGLLLAKSALAEWIGKTGSESGVALAQSWGLSLEMLKASERDIRFKAFSELLGPMVRYDPVLEPVRRYTELCHQQALQRLSTTEAGVPCLPQDVVAAVDDGIWCKFFDPIERARWDRNLAEP
jgi:hypothetical protein